MAEKEAHIQNFYAGINADSVLSQLKAGQLTYALNAVVAGTDGKSFTYQNEGSNRPSLLFKEGYAVIGVKNIPELNKTIFFLCNPDTGEAEIGYKLNDSEIYRTIVNDRCLAFSIYHPIHSVAVKTTNCSSQIYWTDGLNPRRWIDIDNPPLDTNGALDCNQLLVQPNFSVPVITPIETSVGGDLTMGAYQFAIQYANFKGEGYTSFYGITNPINIWEHKFSQDFNLKSTAAINLEFSGIDTSGLYDYYNVVVIKTINGIASAELVGTYHIDGSQVKMTFTGATKSAVRISMEEIFERFPYYDIASDVTTSDNVLLWAGLKNMDAINYQQIWSKVRLQFQTWKIPYSKSEGYFNPVNSALYRGYMGDEVYAFEGCFILKNGKITEKYHIPGRQPLPSDLEIITNLDAAAGENDSCHPVTKMMRWQRYNTAKVIGFCDQYKGHEKDNCYKGPFQYGDFGYWQSLETYPDNTYIWGELAGKPIRHHRFPDSTICPIHDNNNNYSADFAHSIFPKGVCVDVASLYKAIQDSDLTDSQKSQIAGFKILRANRAHSKSVVAKGLLYNVGKYNFEGNDYFYPNYPFNDLRPDPFLSSTRVQPKSGLNNTSKLNGFGNAAAKSRFTFHSPDTHFYQPFGIDSGLLKLETVEYGRATSHFVQVKDNAKYKFLTKDATRLAFSAGMSSVITLSVGGGFGLQAFQAQAGLELGGVIPAFEATLSVIKNITPAINYAWQLNGIGDYCNSYPIQDSGNKIRSISTGAYLSSGMQNIGDTAPVNNLRRESSVYVKTVGEFPFPHQVSSQIPEDNSRYLISENGCSSKPGAITNKNICAYYGAIKKEAPNQYGRMYSYETIDTGYYHPLYNGEGEKFKDMGTVFGGDTFINRFGLKRKFPFFIDETVGKADSTDINLDDLSNVAYPMFWYSTKPVDIDADLSGLEDEIHTLTDTGFWTIVGNLVSGGTKPLRAGFTILNKLFQAYLQVLGVTNVNLDCAGTKNMNETGKAYLYAYGIPYFFTESEVNVDMRQATNPNEGDYFPRVSTSIPDHWLQETNVPIANDNQYIYNSSFSKQNKETYFAALRQDYDPNAKCQHVFENRIIYSEKAHLEETKNNWLIYRPVSYFDLPKDHGPLCGVNGIEDTRILARFANKSLLYNVMATLNTGAATAYLGNPAMFSQPPLDFSQSDTGFAGSLNKFFLSTPAGHIWIDTIRGQVLLLKGNALTDLTENGMSQWFKNSLPFVISTYFPAVDTDNSFHNIGICGVYDAFLQRLIITKKDYLPLDSGIWYDGSKFKIDRKTISTDDSQYFCNLSWTISYSFQTGGWVSFHSYTPGYYVSHPAMFKSGIHGGLYDHNHPYSFGNFYGTQQDYILEYPILNQPLDGIIGAFSDYTTVLKYTGTDEYFEPPEDVYFNKAIIYTDSQCSGVLELIAKPRGNLKAYLSYPKNTPSSRQILFDRSDHIYSFNSFFDIVKEKGKPFFRRPCNKNSLDKIFTGLDYGNHTFHKARIRAKEARIRLIFNADSQYRLISKFVIPQIQPSYK